MPLSMIFRKYFVLGSIASIYLSNYTHSNLKIEFTYDIVQKWSAFLILLISYALLFFDNLLLR